MFIPQKSISQELITNDITVMSLIRSDRGPRRFLKIWPGKEIRWFYLCLDKDGHQFIREATGKFPGIRDQRPSSDTHPNLAFIEGFFNSGASTSILGGVAGGLLMP